MPVKPVLLFAYGNESRGDDALAPLLLGNIQQKCLSCVAGHPLKFLKDYQMQIEHVMDLQNCERVLLIDADSSLDKAFHFYPVTASAESLYTTHGMSPGTLLHTFRKVLKQKPPLTSMLAIQGINFNLGENLSEPAQRNLQLATEFLISLLVSDDFRNWDEKIF